MKPLLLAVTWNRETDLTNWVRIDRDALNAAVAKARSAFAAFPDLAEVRLDGDDVFDVLTETKDHDICDAFAVADMEVSKELRGDIECALGIEEEVAPTRTAATLYRYWGAEGLQVAVTRFETVSLEFYHKNSDETATVVIWGDEGATPAAPDAPAAEQAAGGV
jgi:hypothetical protein